MKNKMTDEEDVNFAEADKLIAQRLNISIPELKEFLKKEPRVKNSLMYATAELRVAIRELGHELARVFKILWLLGKFAAFLNRALQKEKRAPSSKDDTQI